MYAQCLARISSKDGYGEYILQCQDQKLRIIDTNTLIKDISSGVLQVGNLSVGSSGAITGNFSGVLEIEDIRKVGWSGLGSNT